MSLLYFAVAFMTACLISIFYWEVVQRVVLKKILFRLFARRDELRRLAIEGKEEYTSWAYREVEGFLCKTIAVVPAFSLSSFIWFVMKSKKTDQDEFARFHDAASPQLVRLMNQTVDDAFVIMIFNSPLTTIFAAGVALCLWLADKLNRQTMYRKGEDFIDTLPEAA